MNCIIQMVCYHQSIGRDTKKWCLSLSFIRCFFKSMPNSCWNNSDLSIYREVINPEDMEERIVSTVLKHLSLQDTVFKLAKAENQQTEEFILLSAVIQEVYTKIDSLLRQLQVILLNLFQIYLPKYLRGFKTIHELICYYDYKFVFYLTYCTHVFDCCRLWPSWSSAGTMRWWIIRRETPHYLHSSQISNNKRYH